MPELSLDYLEFDGADDGGQTCSLEAMASVASQRLPALLGEIGRVLDWLQLRFGPPGALDDGAAWDMDLQASQETVEPLQVSWLAGAPTLQDGGEPASRRTTVTLALALQAEPAASLRAALGL